MEVKRKTRRSGPAGRGESGSYYYEVLKKLCAAYQAGSLEAVNGLADEFKIFRCSALEEDELLTSLERFMGRIKADESHKKKALKDFFWLVPGAELGKILLAMPRSVERLLLLYEARDIWFLLQRLNSDALAKLIGVLPFEAIETVFFHKDSERL